MEKRKKSSVKKAAFTLIELLVVVSIIGLLSSVALSSFNEARRGAKVIKLKVELKQLVTSIEMYRNKVGEYPQPNGIRASGAANCSDSNSMIPIQTLVDDFLVPEEVYPNNTFAVPDFVSSMHYNYNVVACYFSCGELPSGSGDDWDPKYVLLTLNSSIDLEMPQLNLGGGPDSNGYCYKAP